MDLQSFVALATRTPTSRRRLVEEVKALHFPVYAVDIKMMIGAEKGPLFSDCWNAYGEQIPGIEVCVKLLARCLRKSALCDLAVVGNQ